MISIGFFMLLVPTSSWQVFEVREIQKKKKNFFFSKKTLLRISQQTNYIIDHHQSGHSPDSPPHFQQKYPNNSYNQVICTISIHMYSTWSQMYAIEGETTIRVLGSSIQALMMKNFIKDDLQGFEMPLSLPLRSITQKMIATWKLITCCEVSL